MTMFMRVPIILFILSTSFAFTLKPIHRSIVANRLHICMSDGKREIRKSFGNKKSSSSGKKPFSKQTAEISDIVKMSTEERLQKIIARAGIASRRGAETMISDGRVKVNGQIITELGKKYDPKKDEILVDGKKISLPDTANTFWIILNKPKSTLTTMEDDKDRETVVNLIPRAQQLRLVPVGRLERDSTGLFLLTNEVGWIHPLTHPSFKIPKRYEIVVQGIPTEVDLEQLRKGVQVDDEASPYNPCQIQVMDVDARCNLALIDVKLDDSRPMQLQKMMDFIKCPLISLKRTEFGPIKLKGLEKGKWKELSKSDVEALKKSCIKISKPYANSSSQTKKRYNSKVKGGSSFADKRRRPGSGFVARVGREAVEDYNKRGSAVETTDIVKRQNRNGVYKRPR